MIGREDLSGDDRLNSMGGRGRNRELAESVVRPWLETHTPEEICELGELFRVPVALVGNGRDVLDDGPLRRARGVRGAPGGVPRTAVAVPDVGVAGATGRARARARCRRRRSHHGATRGAEPRPPASGAAGDRPLDGVTVLDLTAFWAGPAAHAPPRHPRRRRAEDRVADPARRHALRHREAARPTPTGWSSAPPSTAPTRPSGR